MTETLGVVLVTDFFPPYVGGVPVHQWELARGLAARGHGVDVVTARLPGTPKQETVQGVRIHRVGGDDRIRRYGFAAGALGPARRLARRADVLQASTFVGAVPGSLAARAAGVPSVLTVHEVFLADWRDHLPGQPVRARMLRAAESALMRLPYDAVVAVSEYTQRRLDRFGWGPGKGAVIPNGVDDAFWRADLADGAAFRARHGLSDQRLFLFFGRAGISKGLPTLLDAWEQAADVQGRLVLVVGDGELMDECRRRVASPSMHARTLLLPALGRGDLRDAVAAADIVVLPSWAEGFGLAHAEACAMGRPVVATDVGPLREVVTGRRILVPARDAAALAGALRRAQAGDFESVPPRRYSWQDTVTAYEALFRRLA